MVREKMFVESHAVTFIATEFYYSYCDIYIEEQSGLHHYLQHELNSSRAVLHTLQQV